MQRPSDWRRLNCRYGKEGAPIQLFRLGLSLQCLCVCVCDSNHDNIITAWEQGDDNDDDDSDGVKSSFLTVGFWATNHSKPTRHSPAGTLDAVAMERKMILHYHNDDHLDSIIVMMFVICYIITGLDNC